MLVIVGSIVHMDWQPKYQSTKFEQQQIPHGCNIYGYTVQNWAFIFSLKVISKILYGKSTSHTHGLEHDIMERLLKGYSKVFDPNFKE